MRTDTRLIRASVRVYGWLLAAYPADHRQTFGADMRQLFRDQCRDATQSGTLIGLWLRTFPEIVITAAREHLDARKESQLMERNSWFVLVLALILAGVVGWINIAASEMQAIMGTLLVAGFVLGMVQPKGAWRWAVILVVGIFLSGLIAHWLGINSAAYVHARQVHPDLPLQEDISKNWQTLIVIVPALIATYGGVIVAKLAKTMIPPRTPTQQA